MTRAARGLLLLLAAGCATAAPTAAPTAATPEVGLVFRLVPPRGAPAITAATLPGTFNDWSTTATPLVRQPDGSWVARVPQAVGRHEFKLHVDGAWIGDMCRDLTWGDPARDYRVGDATQACVGDGQGGRNAVATLAAPRAAPGVGFTHDPALPAHVSAAGGRLSVRFVATAGHVRVATLRAGDVRTAMHRQLSVDGRETWRGTLPEGTARYAVVVESDEGTREHGPYDAPAAPFRAVAWVGDGIGYQIFPDRFANGDPTNDSLAITTDEWPLMDPAVRGAPPVLSVWNGPVTALHCCHQYFGGDLRGVTDRLDHLQALGVTLLWLNPIFLAGSAHGYDTWDYTRVDPAMGDEAALRALLDAARARGIRVIWDFVPNHVGVGHAAFRDAVARGPASPTWDWFSFRVPPAQVRVGDGAHYDTFAGAGALPKLNVARPAVREHLLAAVRRWGAFGFAGLRVDVPNEVTDGPAFFRELRRTVKGADPDAYLVGEIWRRAPEWVQGDRFDALMNYAVGQDAIERFVRGELSGVEALDAIARVVAEYPEAATAMQFNVVATHDNARLLTKLGGGGLGATPGAGALARQRLASAMLYALPGVPVTFQGDECAFLGAGGGGTREENRYPMQWARCDAAMLAHYRRLGALRRSLPALRAPAIRLLAADGARLLWARGEPGADEVLAAFNAGPAGALALPAGDWTDAVTGENVKGRVELAALGWRYLRRP